jgi:hypothetical protein
MDKELLSPDEVQSIGLRFLQSKYYNAKVTIEQNELVADGPSPVYHLEGRAKFKSRDLLGRLIYREKGFTIKMQMDAIEGSILSYELE